MWRRPFRKAKAGSGHRGRLRPRSLLFDLLLPGAVIAGLAALRVWDPAPVEALRLQVFDLYQRIDPRETSEYPVVIVDIDDASLQEVGQWPWPRNIVGRMLIEIFRRKAAVVGFDVVFADPDRLSPPALAEQLPGLGPELRERLRSLPGNDERFAALLQKVPVVLAQAPVGRAGAGLDRGRPVKTAVAQVGGDPRPYLFTYGGTVRNLPTVEKAARGLGSVTLSPETDGVARRVPLVVQVGEHVVPTLAVEMLRVATGQRAIAVKSNKAGVDSIVVARVTIPTDRHARKWVHFAEPDPARYVSAKDVLAGEVPRERLAGKLVLVGTSATALADIKATPVSPAMPGVEVHAQLLETILSQSNLVRPNYALGAELVSLVGFCLLVAVFTPMVNALVTLLLGGGLAGGFAAGAWYLYSTEGILIDFGYTAAASFALYAMLGYIKYQREEKARKSIRRAFSQYLSPELVGQLAAHPQQLQLGGASREITVMFSDIRNFTTISERLSAEELTQLVNRVLTCLSEPVLAHKGTIDKYIGDCLMAFWNAPLDDPEHARNACLAALEMTRALPTLGDELRAGEDLRLAIGVGLNTGECYAGNMGSEQRFNYSVLGDAVNLASRLEAQTKTYGCPVIVNETTAAQAPDLAFLEIDEVRVKGKTAPSRIFALLGDGEVRAQAEFGALAEAHAEMLRAYAAGDWEDARRHLAACRQRQGDWPLERVYDIYAERIAEREAEASAPRDAAAAAATWRQGTG